MNEKVKQALESIVQRFEKGDIPDVIILSTSNKKELGGHNTI